MLVALKLPAGTSRRPKMPGRIGMIVLGILGFVIVPFAIFLGYESYQQMTIGELIGCEIYDSDSLSLEDARRC